MTPPPSDAHPTSAAGVSDSQTAPPVAEQVAALKQLDTSALFLSGSAHEGPDAEKRFLEELRATIASVRDLLRDFDLSVEEKEWCLRETVSSMAFPSERVDDPDYNALAKVDVFASHLQRARKTFWTAGDIPANTYSEGLDQLPEPVQVLMIRAIAIILILDNQVLQTLSECIERRIKDPMLVAFLKYQAAIETEHAITYTNMWRGVTRGRSALAELGMRWRETALYARAKVAWAREWLSANGEKGLPFGCMLLMHACTEYLFFTPVFAFFYWLRQNYPSSLPGCIQGNELIAEDEWSHFDFAVCVYESLKNKIPTEAALAIVRSAVKTAMTTSEIVPPGLPGLSPAHVQRYVNFTANKFCSYVGLPFVAPEERENPLPCMAGIDQRTRVNFFESSSGSYQKAKITIGLQPRGTPLSRKTDF
jgi:ribonucleotide reductase beta subunit family protein with ferritin-like domain